MKMHFTYLEFFIEIKIKLKANLVISYLQIILSKSNCRAEGCTQCILVQC